MLKNAYRTVTSLIAHRCLQVEEIKALAGVDYLTISPSLLQNLLESDEPVPQKLEAVTGKSLQSQDM